MNLPLWFLILANLNQVSKFFSKAVIVTPRWTGFSLQIVKCRMELPCTEMFIGFHQHWRIFEDLQRISWVKKWHCIVPISCAI